MTDLIAQYAGTTAEKNALISASILYLRTEKGMPMDQAFDVVLGEGAYERMVDGLYHELRGEG